MTYRESGTVDGEKPAQKAGWVPFQPAAAVVSLDSDRWLGLLGLRSFRILLWFGIAAIVSLILGHASIRDTIPWFDVATAVTLSVVLWLVTRRPDWLKPLSWIVLVSLLLDVLDGLWPPVPPAIRSTYILMPMLVLYGALLCDIAITLAAMAAVLGLCAFTWFTYTPLAAVDALMLFSVVLATVISGATSLGIWIHHRRLMRELRQQAQELRIELETNNHLTAVLFHDIANPLAALVGTLDLARAAGKDSKVDVDLLDRMAGKIVAIIETARLINSDRLREMPTEMVTADRMVRELREVFSGRLASKSQTLSLTAGSGLAVRTIPGILLNSVLGNLLSNAIKFSPPGSSLEIQVARTGERLRIEIRDRGEGFPPEFFERGAGRARSSRPGTEGETGSGYGLNIVALYVAKLGGTLEIMNREDGGAAASVLLPA